MQDEYILQRTLIYLSHVNKQARELVFREWFGLMKKFEPANWKESKEEDDGGEDLVRGLGADLPKGAKGIGELRADVLAAFGMVCA